MSNGQPRRVSIFGGVLWILIGGLLLANNLIASFGVWELFGKYWPVLLILLGIAKLFDHFTTRTTGGAPARLLSGGEVLLLLLLFLVGGAVAFTTRVTAEHPELEIRFPWYREFTFTEEAMQPAKPGVPVRLELPRGDVNLIAEETDQIRVLVNKRVYTGNEEQARERAKDWGIEIADTGSTYAIRPKSGSRRVVRMDVEVHLPKGSTVYAETSRGDVRANGLANELKVKANGDVELRDVAGNVEAEVDGDVLISGIGGDLKVTGSCDDIDVADVKGGANVRCGFTGRAQFRNVAKQLQFKSVRTDLTLGSLPGRVEVGAGDLDIVDAPADVTLITRNYDITLENVAGRVKVRNRHGDVEIRMPKPPTDEIEIENERGGVELILPENSAFEVNASTRQGEVESDFSGLKVNNDDREGRIEGTVGNRGPQVRLKTTYGTIAVRKGR